MAAWDDVPEITDKLADALNTFDWDASRSICRSLTDRINGEAELFPEKDAGRILSALRRKRQFELMAIVADALINSGRTEALIRRLYAQAFIDQSNVDPGKLTAAEAMLRGILQDPASPARELNEARGLLGRIYKQRYVDAKQPDNPRQQQNLRWAIAAYDEVYRGAPAKFLWHGINVVACLARAERDGVDVTGVKRGDYREFARQILQVLHDLEDEKGSLEYWDRATALEAHVALGEFGEAIEDLRDYMRDGNTDAFECASTLRQLREVWEIERLGNQGTLIRAGLNSALLKRSGGEVQLQSNEVQQGLELNFSAVGDLPLEWWRKGLERCAAIARVEDRSGRRVGTGFLVRRGDFLNDGSNERLMLTNWHVISEAGEHPLSVRPENARANFEACGRTYQVNKNIVAFSRKLDATFVALDQFEGLDGHCPLEPAPTPFDAVKKPRVYVIGYPGGRGLSFSVHDSIWLDTDGEKLHYRTPTEPGSSGSPVFDQDNWTLIGLHHAGKQEMPKLKGQPGTYEANEGLAVEAIRTALKTSLKS